MPGNKLRSPFIDFSGEVYVKCMRAAVKCMGATLKSMRILKSMEPGTCGVWEPRAMGGELTERAR